MTRTNAIARGRICPRCSTPRGKTSRGTGNSIEKGPGFFVCQLCFCRWNVADHPDCSTSGCTLSGGIQHRCTTPFIALG